MKSGNSKSKDLFEKRINKEFEDYHNEESCAGKWSVIHRDDFPYKLDTRMFVTIKHAPFVHCSDCGASYFVPGFEDWIQKRIAVEILRQESIISKPSLRYLRTLTGKTQKEMGEFLGINKEEYSKFESIKNETRRLNPDRQARIKLIFADLLDIDDPQVLRHLGYISEEEAEGRPPRILDAESFDLKTVGIS